MTTLAERRAQQGAPKKPRTTCDVTRIDGKNLLVEKMRLFDELVDLQATVEATEDGEPVGPPPKVGARGNAARVAEIRTELRAVDVRLAEFQDVLTIEGAWTGGAWHLWKEAHPARDGETVDRTIALGWCNATDLLAVLGEFVIEVNGEPVAPGDWDSWLAEDYIYADRREVAKKVIGLYEMKVERAPKSPSGSSGTDLSATD